MLDLFSGIGGFTLGLERTGGFKTVAFCEIEPFPRKVLKKHWPDVPIYEDVRNVTKRRLDADGIRPTVVTGGFPCQDISVAGSQTGIEAERSGLWGDLARIISEVRPQYAIVENVTALLSGDNGRWFQRILSDLAEIGYDTEWHCIPASELGAHHHRDRIWIIAYPQHTGCDGTQITGSDAKNVRRSTKGQDSAEQSAGVCGAGVVPNTQSKRVQRQWTCGQQKPRAHEKQILSVRHCEGCNIAYWKVEPELGRVVDGVPDRAHRIKGLGNAVVPQIPEMIGRAILETENDISRTQRR